MRTREFTTGIAKTLSSKTAGVPDQGPFRIGQIISMDIDTSPPTANIGTDDGEGARPVRIAGRLWDYRPGQSVVWLDWGGSPVIIAPLSMAGADPLDLDDDIDPWHLIGATNEPAFQNSWGNFGGAHATAGFYKQPDGWTRLKGLVSGGTSTATIYTLPVGYRPPVDLFFTSVSNNAECAVRINTDGTITKPIGGSNTHVSLNGITFPTVWNRSQWILPKLESAWNRSSQPSPTAETFIRDDGWVWLKGIIDGTLTTRMLTLPELSRVRQDHILACVDIPLFSYNRIGLSYKGVLVHDTGAAQVNLGGKNWFSANSSAVWTAPTFLNSWTNLGTPFESIGYYLDHMGICHLQGVGTGSNNSPIFNLPAGLRPLEQHVFFTVAQGESVGRVDVLANGNVQRALGSNGYLSFTGINFRVEA